MSENYRFEAEIDTKHHDHMEKDMKHGMMMEDGCGMMDMLMGEMWCEGASSLMAYAAPLAAAIVVAAF